MKAPDLNIIKASGEKAKFSREKVVASLQRSGAKPEVVQDILAKLSAELYDGISTREIYNRAYNLLNHQNHFNASKYKLKNAIYELGPTGFPFEKFIGAVFNYSGYKVEVGKIIQGECVSHEVDVVAVKDHIRMLMECKFHSEHGRNCDVKVPLYIDSRFRDIRNFQKSVSGETGFNEGWVVTNTRFTEDARNYGKCVGLNLLSWDYPKGKSLKDRIDRIGLYPITVSGLLSQREKQFLLSRDVVLCRELIHDDFYLDHLGISEKRKSRILNEMEVLCNYKNEKLE